jgi:membrane protein
MCGVAWKRFAKNLYLEISNHHIFNGAAALAYYLMLSIFPSAIFLLSLLPFLPVPHLQQAIMDLLGQALPQQSAQLFTGVVNDVVSNRSGGLLSFGLIFLIWSGSSGLYAVMQQLNVTYGVKESRPFWKVRGTAILLMVVFFLLVVGAFSLIVFGGVLQNFVGSHLGWSKPLSFFFMVFHWVVVSAFLLLALAITYYFGPDVEQKFRFVTAGSVLGVILLVLASLGFRYYVAHFSNYSAAYGSLGAVIILQLWLYIVGIVLLVGWEVNMLVALHNPDFDANKR